MARQCCRDSVAMKVIAEDKAETEGYITPCRWCERHATYRGGRWVYSEEDEVGLRHATSAALLTHPDRVARIADVLGKPLLPCHTCGHRLVIAPVDNRCPVCDAGVRAPPRIRTRREAGDAGGSRDGDGSVTTARIGTMCKLGPCRIGFHAWPKWADCGDGKLTARDMTDPKQETFVTGFFTQQMRRCERCGKLQYRREKVS